MFRRLLHYLGQPGYVTVSHGPVEYWNVQPFKGRPYRVELGSSRLRWFRPRVRTRRVEFIDIDIFTLD